MVTASTRQGSNKNSVWICMNNQPTPTPIGRRVDLRPDGGYRLATCYRRWNQDGIDQHRLYQDGICGCVTAHNWRARFRLHLRSEFAKAGQPVRGIAADWRPDALAWAKCGCRKSPSRLTGPLQPETAISADRTPVETPEATVVVEPQRQQPFRDRYAS